MTAAPWFAAQLKPQGAGLALDHLARQGFDAFLPRRSIDRRAGNRFRPALEPLFPGYVFVSFDPDDPAARSIRSTRGITRLVGNARGPSALPAGFVAALRARCDAQGLILPEPVLAPGAEVRILSGPFAGLLGRVLTAGPTERVQVLLTLLAAERAVAFDRARLARA
jgi:transcriptional antiterminator RfaH